MEVMSGASNFAGINNRAYLGFREVTAQARECIWNTKQATNQIESSVSDQNRKNIQVAILCDVTYVMTSSWTPCRGFMLLKHEISNHVQFLVRAEESSEFHKQSIVKSNRPNEAAYSDARLSLVSKRRARQECVVWTVSGKKRFKRRMLCRAALIAPNWFLTHCRRSLV